MAEFDIWSMLVLLGVPSALTGFCFWLIQRRITNRDKKYEAAEQERAEREHRQEEAREALMVLAILGTNASLSLCEATAKAVQKIPDAHCNGDMHAALNYAGDVKKQLDTFLAKQGVHSVL